MFTLALVVGVFLLIAGLIDLVRNQVPSVFMTSIIFVILVVNPSSIIFGVMGFVFALILYDAGFIKGVADIKGIVIVSLMVLNLYYFIWMIVFILCLGMIYTIVIYLFKNKIIFKDNEVPFVIIIFFVYVSLSLLKGLI